MSRLHDTPESMLALARRAALAEQEKQALERLLATSESLRVALRTGRDFDRIADTQVGDEMRIARFVSGALRARTQQRSSSRATVRMSGWLLAAAVLASSGLAFGLRGVWLPALSHFRSDPARKFPLPSAQQRGGPINAVSPRGEPVNVQSAATAPAEKEPIRIAVATAVAPARSSAPSSPRAAPLASVVRSAVDRSPVERSAVAAFNPESTTEPTADSLFAAANLSRNRGRLSVAVAQFRELQERFAGSPQAVLSLVSLGKLLLLRGEANAALDQFARYLRVNGPLAEEAMVGEAQALGLLGRGEEEEQTWRIFLARFPQSVYVGQAQQRLGSLETQGR